jgi:hypothetical protein
MVTSELLILLGDLTIGFAELDEALSDLVCDLMRCDEAEVAWPMISAMDYSRKVQRGQELVKFYADKFGLQQELLVTETVQALKRAGTIGISRNNIISPDGSKHVFKHHKKGNIDASEAAVRALITEAKDVTLLLLQCWIGLNRRLDKLYSEIALGQTANEGLLD